MDEIRPERGGIFFPDLARDIVERYRFQAFPERVNPGQVVKFETGMRELDGVISPIISFDIYSDGVAMTSYNTADADALLDDFMQWAITTYRFREPQTILPRRYNSRIVVDVQSPAGNMLINKFNTVSQIVTKRFAAEQPLELTQLNVGPNPPTQYPFLHTWVFQPRIAQPYVRNRYYSAAPLSTEDHFAMLQEIEAALGSN